jgi:hypothetical protein
MYHILSHSSDSEYAADLQEVLKMSISILRDLAIEWALLHLVMRAGLSSKLPSSMFISGPVLTLALDGAEKSLMHLQAAISAGSCAVVITKICRQSLKRGIRTILMKKALIETSLSEILDPNSNWLVNQIRSCNSL